MKPELNSIADIIELLKPPNDDNRIALIIPDDIRKQIQELSINGLEINNFIETFLNRPGFLYNITWLSTFLGIKVESFKKVEHYFEKAKYTGRYSSDFFSLFPPKYWLSEVRAILFSSENIFEKDTEGLYLPWELGRHLKGISTEDYSKCQITGEDRPETVAFADRNSMEEIQVKMMLTELDPRFSQLLYFEELRFLPCS